MNTLSKRRKEIAERVKKEKSIVSPSLPHDELLDYLYSLDENGKLDLSLGMVMSQKCRPEIRQYVEDNLLRSSSVSPSMCYDPDTALDNVTPFCMQYGLERDVVAQRSIDKFKQYIEKHKDVS